MPGQRFVDGVVHHLKHQMVQTGAVRGIADVHARALAHGLQAFEDLDGAFAVGVGGACLVGVNGGLEVGAVRAAVAGVDALAGVVVGGVGLLILGHGEVFW